MSNSTSPRELPLIFKGPMVRAIMDGRKTVTRRVPAARYRNYVPGTQVWVRETWNKAGWSQFVFYRATDKMPDEIKWRPSIHMPKWATRIWLTVTDLREEPLHDIDDDDAQREGIVINGNGGGRTRYPGVYVHQFIPLWNSLYAARGYSWNDNPDVARIGFEVQNAKKGR